MKQTNTSPIQTNIPIRGWLILPILGLFISIIMTCYNICSGIIELSYEEWMGLSESYPWFCAFLVLFMIFGIIQIAISVRLLILVFSYDIRTPMWFISYLIYLAIIVIMETVILYHYAGVFNDASMTLGEPNKTLRQLIGFFIWILYFLRSTRVKNTFTKIKRLPS